jgi:hypothetical protein
VGVLLPDNCLPSKTLNQRMENNSSRERKKGKQPYEYEKSTEIRRLPSQRGCSGHGGN